MRLTLKPRGRRRIKQQDQSPPDPPPTPWGERWETYRQGTWRTWR